MQAARKTNSTIDQDNFIGQFIKQGRMAIFVFLAMLLGFAPLFLYFQFNPNAIDALISMFMQN